MPSKIFFFKSGRTDAGTENNAVQSGSAEQKTKISLFHAALFRKNLIRFWPLWAVASLTALVPLSLLGNLLRYGNALALSPAEFSLLYYETVVYIVPLLMLFYCICVAACVWNYLYNPRAVGMIHSLPIRRETLFVTNFLSGMAMILIPCVITGSFAILLSVGSGAFEAKALFITILCVAGEGFFYFSTATAAAFLTGHAFALPFLYFIFHFLEYILDLLTAFLSSGMIFGIENYGYTGTLGFLTPTIYLHNHMQLIRNYSEVQHSAPDNVYYERHLLSVELHGMGIIGWYVLAGCVLLGLAWLFYRRRRSECAGDVISVGWGKPVFQYGVAAVAALGGGQLLYLMLWNGFDQDDGPYTLIPLVICMALAGAIGYYAAAMLLAKSLKVFTKQSLRGVGMIAAGCLILCSALHFDVFGIAKRIPSDDEITSVTLRIAGNGYAFNMNEDPEIIAQIREVQSAIVNERNYIQDSEVIYDSEKDESILYVNGEPIDSEWDWTSFWITWFLKNGRIIRRSYPLYLTQTRMDTPGTVDYLLDTFVNSTEMKMRRLHINDSHYKIYEGWLNRELRRDYPNLSTREAEKLLDAVWQDAIEGTWGDTDWFDKAERYALNLTLRFQSSPEEFHRLNDNGETYSMDTIHIQIRPAMQHTIETLVELDLADSYDFVTYDELAVIRDAEEDKHADDFPDDYEFAEYYDGFPYEEFAEVPDFRTLG